VYFENRPRGHRRFFSKGSEFELILDESGKILSCSTKSSIFLSRSASVKAFGVIFA
jgi:hypothetical protein